MRVIILTAGKGERLYPLTKNTPKALLEIGGGETILESQLNNFRKAGIQEVVLVVGYKAEQIEAKVKDIKDLTISTVYNPFFDVSNNLVSAWMARFYMDSDFILVNGDDIFNQRVLKGLLEHGEDICMVIDRKATYDEEDMKVVSKGKRLYKVSKEIPLGEANGESIGMMKFSGNGCRIFRETLDQMVRNKPNLNIFYLAALQSIMDSGFPVHFHECAETDWAEVDIHPDLQTVREQIEQHLERLKQKVQ